MNQMGELTNLPRLARRLGVTAKFLRAEADAGRIPCIRAGTRYLFDAPTVERVLAQRASRFDFDPATHPDPIRLALCIATGRALKKRGIAQDVIRDAVFVLLEADLEAAAADGPSLLVIDPAASFVLLMLVTSDTIAQTLERTGAEPWAGAFTVDIRSGLQAGREHQQQPGGQA